MILWFQINGEDAWFNHHVSDVVLTLELTDNSATGADLYMPSARLRVWRKTTCGVAVLTATLLIYWGFF